MIRGYIAILSVIVLLFETSPALAETFPRPQIEFAPRVYSCQRTTGTVVIDGNIVEDSWLVVPWTGWFVDIEGESAHAPRHRTKACLLWDDEYLYIAAAVFEPHIQASFTKRDSYIYQLDNDFEAFIDPDGDGHNYYEIEINALNTVWDLLLTKPYRDGGTALHAWDIPGLRTAVFVSGTLNDPGDIDHQWTVEIAIPWTSLAEAAGTDCPPRPGDRWRMNFSRVEWRFVEENGKYVKEIDPATGLHYPENNWVWSPQGLIAMHYPEMWGIVEFTDQGVGNSTKATGLLDEDYARHALYQVYYNQRDWRLAHGCFSADADEMACSVEPPPGYSWPPVIEAAADWFKASICDENGERLSIAADGRVRREGS